ncbi:acid phosphatase type 7-like [Cydia splendana]|uniref:acid phosphatase type 7-like n=1 Tax=Cydia splendana TaxID=1100963 RepID=UPI002138CC37
MKSLGLFLTLAAFVSASAQPPYAGLAAREWGSAAVAAAEYITVEPVEEYLPPIKQPYYCSHCNPEQVHIAFGEKSNDIVVTWSTFNDTPSVVHYGVEELQHYAYGASSLFEDGGNERRQQYTHRVTLPDLQYDTKYVYNVGSEYGVSSLFSFRTVPKGNNWPVRAAVFGDMGTEGAKAMPYLQEESEMGHFDLILHVGDMGYDMATDNARVGDQFMRQIEPIATMVPYMTCVGNHEEAYNFSNYRERFSMPGGTESMFYSFDLGPVHFVAISTEYYYYIKYGVKMIYEQYQWLEKDLAMASHRENRTVRPWIVLMGHRPMYCSNADDLPDCEYEFSRTGNPFFGHGLEPLLQQYAVDLVFWAHEHSYERLWPLYNNTVYNGSLAAPYTDPRAPVHIVTGSAGNHGGQDPFTGTHPPWSAFRTDDFGYTRMVVHNHSHIYIEQTSVERNGDVVDSFWLVKHKLSFNDPDH